MYMYLSVVSMTTWYMCTWVLALWLPYNQQGHPALHWQACWLQATVQLYCITFSQALTLEQTHSTACYNRRNQQLQRISKQWSALLPKCTRYNPSLTCSYQNTLWLPLPLCSISYSLTHIFLTLQCPVCGVLCCVCVYDVCECCVMCVCVRVVLCVYDVCV